MWPNELLCPRSSLELREGILVSPCNASLSSLSSSLYLFFSKSLPLLFQSVGREVNKNTQWKFWNFLTIFKVFRPKNWKIVKNFKIELVPQFCLDPKDTWGLVRYRFWPKNVGIRILIFVPVFLKNGFKNMRFSAFRVHGCIFSVAHDQTLIFHLEFISGIRFLKNPFFNKKMVFFRVFKFLFTLTLFSLSGVSETPDVFKGP